MDFSLSKEHEMARQLFKDFAETEVKPLAQEIDQEHRFPRETVEKLAKGLWYYRCYRFRTYITVC